MSGRYLLDTNIIIALFEGEASIVNNLARADEVFIPSIALGELHYGARKSGRSQKNLERIEEFVASNTIVFYGNAGGNLYKCRTFFIATIAPKICW